MTSPRSIPRWTAVALAPLVWLVALPVAHGVVPWAIAHAGPRYGWHAGGPATWNLLGLVPVAAAVVVLGWTMVFGFTQARRMPERITLDWTPKILATRGPFAYSRNPMYLAELALWLGWAILYGSVLVLAVFVVFMFGVRRIVAKEERDLEAVFGEEYREYTRQVPRWFRVQRK